MGALLRRYTFMNTLSSNPRIALPITADKGLGSPLSNHFGKAPFHIVVELRSGRPVQTITKPDADPNRCAPIEELAASGASIIVCRGMGAGAMKRLQANGMSLFHTEAATVADALAALRSAKLPALDPSMTCAGHEHEHEHEHDHGHHHHHHH